MPSIIKLEQALMAWGTPEFPDVLKRELVQSGVSQLPLQQGLSTGNYVADEPITVVINKVVEMDDVIRVTAGIFFRSVIGGCSCADDPTPASDIDEYCELQLDINRMSAATTVSLLKDG
ncbi:hypothetical protein [Sideroxydans lithotrophicus]|uniref:Uncharacterized protein n=1 Tax=Sideroxydans lithotrophicus (strain ES-1) TaxID=580332 RepID=D5CR89_SIDLE|nr:hypothetical protein [Sideroxydans lithotrophicus]ADE11475.1 conserved hypothetical protein [Sideroxydans lithotrophicus ES-1]